MIFWSHFKSALEHFYIRIKKRVHGLHGGWRHEPVSSPAVKYFTGGYKAVPLLWIICVISVLLLLLGIFFIIIFFFLVFAISLCTSVYMCLVVTWWERADLLALVCGV